MSSLDEHLKQLVAELSAELPEVTEGRMFGSTGFWANGTIYALVWDGRVVLRFPDAARAEKAAALPGSDIFDPMKTGKMKISKWVVMPEEFADHPEALVPWLEEAHREAMREPPKKKKVAKPKATTPARAPARRKARGPAKRT